MGLKPIGSEKLTGSEKIQRILEIANYNLNVPKAGKTLQTESFTKKLADGADYRIVLEKNGYIIQRSLNEGYEYLDVIGNRKHYRSYSDALKKLNLIAKEMNERYGDGKEASLFNEQKKFVLKTPAPKMDAPAPMPAPAPEAPMPAGDPAMGGGMPMGGDMDPMGVEDPLAGGDPGMDGPNDPDTGMPDNVNPSFKVIQKLTGKLGQKIREFNISGELSSSDMKYIINSVLSALELDKLEDHDRESIMDKLDPDNDFGGGMDDMDGVDDQSLADAPMPEMGEEFDADDKFTHELGEEFGDGENAPEMGNSDPDLDFVNRLMDSIFAESRVKKILGKYLTEENEISVKDIKRIERLSNSAKQEMSSKQFLKENRNAKLLGRTNLGNILFEKDGEHYKIDGKGTIK